MANNQQALSSDASRLIEKCVAHLAAERQLLERFIELSHDIQDLLGKNVFPEPQTRTVEQEAMAADAQRVAELRKQVKLAIAEHLSIPADQATIQKFIDSLPEQSAQLLNDERQKILDLHAEISQLSNSNALLLQQSIDIYQRILHGLAGEQPRAQIYSANGQMNRQQTLSMVSTKG